MPLPYHWPKSKQTRNRGRGFGKQELGRLFTILLETKIQKPWMADVPRRQQTPPGSLSALSVASKETPISISKPHTAGMLTYVYTPPLQILMLQEQLESSGNW